MTTRVFKNDLALDEESCQKFIEDAFQIRYPLLMRRYRFFTYQRQGNQTFTNFYGNLIELANAAQLENMTQSDYLIYRIIAGINDSTAVDKLLSIPLADFTLEEVHRVGVTCESAKNYSGIIDKQQNVSCKIFNKKPPSIHPQIPASQHFGLQDQLRVPLYCVQLCIFPFNNFCLFCCFLRYQLYPINQPFQFTYSRFLVSAKNMLSND